MSADVPTKISLLCARQAQAVEKNKLMLDPGIDNIIQIQAQTACGVHRALLDEARDLLDAVALWTTVPHMMRAWHM